MDWKHNSFSKPFGAGSYDMVAKLGGYGVVLEELYFSSEKCQQRQGDYEGGKVVVNHDMLGNNNIADCFYTLPVFYVRPQTLTNGEWGGYQSTPCHMLRMNITFPDRKTVGKTWVSSQVNSLINNDWYCCHTNMAGALGAYYKLCQNEGHMLHGPAPEWY
jgi:hypothetical protein